ncbi:MAG TPA: hypothetical protein VLE97_08825 [Gaiellaceae bacterium]|nr:hypothetical protein [Gaiellaceae bacterium]
MSSVVRLELTLDEAELVGAAVCRDRDRMLDDAFGNRGTRLITDEEEALVPLHQEILRKIEVSVTAPPQGPLNKAIDAIVGVAGSPGAELGKADLGKVRELCEAFSADALAIAIDVHRASCRQDDCPVLAVMVATAKARESSIPHPSGLSS